MWSCRLYRNAFVADCVEYFYCRRVLDRPRRFLEPVRKMAAGPWRHLEPLPATAARHAVPPLVDEAGDHSVVYRKPYQPPRVWQRSGMRCADPEMSESAAASADRHPSEPSPRGRKPRFSSRNTELEDKLDMDQVLSVLDRMHFKPSKSKVTCTTPENVSNVPSVDASASAVVSCDNTEQTVATKEAFASYSSHVPSVLDYEDETTSSDDDVSPLRDLSVCTDVGNTDLARARSADVPHIPGSVDAWKSLCTLDSDSTSGETSESDLGSIMPADHMLDSAVPDSLPVSITASYHPSSNNMQLAAVIGRGRNSSAKRGAVNSSELWVGNSTVPENSQVSITALSPSAYRPSSSNPQFDAVVSSGRNTDAKRGAVNSSELRVGYISSPDTSHTTPRHLSANASYVLEQEEGDVIIESEEEDGDDDDDDDDYEDWC